MEDFTIEKRDAPARSSYTVVIKNPLSLESSMRMYARISELTAREGADLQIDLGGLEKVTREGMGMLLGLVSSVRAAGGRAKIVNPSGRFLAEMRMIGAGRHFEID